VGTAGQPSGHRLRARYSGNARDFDYLASRLATEARVIAIDFPGRGDSEWPASTLAYSFHQFVADARTLLARLRLKEVDWVGTSMGGLLGMMLAAQASSPVRRLLMNDVGAYLPLEALQAISHNLEAPESFPSLEAVEAYLRRSRAQWGKIADEEWRAMALHQSRPVKPGSRQYRCTSIPASPGSRARCRSRRASSSGTPGIACVARCCSCGGALARLPREHRAHDGRHPAGRAPGDRPGCGHVPSLMTEEQVARVRNFLQDAGIQRQERYRDETPTSLTARAA
jgi:pimeloyl-ACP methyl ester carboxylesterase